MELSHFNNALAGGAKKKKKNTLHKSVKPMSAKISLTAFTTKPSKSKIITFKPHSVKPLFLKKKKVITPSPYTQPEKLQYKVLKAVKKITDLIGYKDYKNLVVKKITPKTKLVNHKVHVKSYNKHSPKSPSKKKDVHVKAYDRDQKVKPKMVKKTFKIKKVIGYK